MIIHGARTIDNNSLDQFIGKDLWILVNDNDDVIAWVRILDSFDRNGKKVYKHNGINAEYVDDGWQIECDEQTKQRILDTIYYRESRFLSIVRPIKCVTTEELFVIS